MIRLMLRSLAYYWRSHLGVFGGTLLAGAVLTGALLVGDSVNYSLQTFATLRLGGVHHALDTRGQLIAEALAPRLEQAAGAPAVSALHLRGMALSQPQTGAESTQINNVQVIGVEERFWAYGQGTPVALGPHETALNSKLAHTLGVREGDAVSLRVAKPSLMARDSPLSSREEDRSIRNRYTVRRVLSDEEMGRFGLTPSQIAPHNAFVSLPFLQTQVEQREKINLVLLGEAPVDRAMDQALKQAWQLRDIGLSLRTCSDGVVQLESERIFLNEETAQAALSIPEARGTLTYLATSLAKGNKLTPYFFVVAGALREQLGENDMVINRWMANELRAGLGDAVTLTSSQLLPSNKFEDASRGFTVRGIVEMESLAAEKERMPIFPGLSDVESCSDWDVGMP
ncbi:MAG: hypothetical protein HYZ00_03790, partial [Candidatus Hydrogenedentes bacterium]|nr:hypothetical protein [Candidatus Hydrogenedentota bacterium]